MKKILYFPITIAVIIAASFSSCGNKQLDADGLSFDSVVVDTTTYIPNGTDTLFAQLHLNILLAKGPNASTINDSILRSGILSEDFMPKDTAGMTAEQKLRAFAAEFIKSYRTNCEEFIRSGMQSNTFNYGYDVTSKVQGDSIVNYTMSGDIYLGGAHGTSITIAKNFNRHTGAILSKNSLFSAEAEKTVKGMITKDLMRQFNVNSLTSLQDEGVFMGMKPYVPNNFIIGADSITFIYMQDEMSPHALGEIHSTLPMKDIKKLMKK